MSSTVGPSASPLDRAHALDRLFDAVRDGLYVGLLAPDPHRDTTFAANTALRRLLGYAAQVPDTDILALSAAHVAEPGARAALIEALSSGACVGYPLLMRRADGSGVAVEVTANARTLMEGWTQVEAVIREAGSASGQGDTAAESVGLTLAGVAHELNSPLGTIVSWSERLLDRPLDPLAKRGLEIIVSEAHRASRLARNLLVAGGARQTTRALVEVNRLVQDTLALRADEHRTPRVVVRTDLARGVPPILADAHQIQQVLLNLLTNAEHAMVSAHGGGSLLVRTRHDEQRRMLVLEVHDDGPGVAPHVRARMFDPFFTTKPATEGTGLGLTVAGGIVRAHGGSIRVESEPGQGASFFVELPALAAAPRPAGAEGRPDLAGVSVLLVEDERELASIVGEVLAREGMRVDYASNGAEAAARVLRNEYDVVICDLQMPGVDGMECYRAIAATTPALARRVIFVTGDTAAPEATRFFADTGCRVVAKPFRFADLLRAVRDTLA